MYLPWFKHLRPADSGVISTPKPLKNLSWNLHCHFATPNHEKLTKMTPTEILRGSQNPSKINPTSIKIKSGPQGVLLGVPGHPRITKMVSLGPKWSLQASQIAGLGTPNQPFQYSPSPAGPPSCQSSQSRQACKKPVHRLQEGPAAGAKPSDICSIYI
jgi:hypothetical protein